MRRRRTKFLLGFSLLAGLAIASAAYQTGRAYSQMKAEIAQKTQRISELERTVDIQGKNLDVANSLSLNGRAFADYVAHNGPYPRTATLDDAYFVAYSSVIHYGRPSTAEHSGRHVFFTSTGERKTWIGFWPPKPDTPLNTEVRRRLIGAFSELDKNKDGYIDKKEIMPGFHKARREDREPYMHSR